MPTSDPAEILLIQNRWAMRKLIEACSTLTDAQFHQRFDMGPGSLHDVIVHMLSAMRGWGDLLAGREQREGLEGPTRSTDELLRLLDDIADDFEASARAHPCDEIVTGSRGGRTYSFTRGAVLTHVMTHGMHHRAQALNMLRQMGIEKLPPSAVIEWIFLADDPPPAP